MEGEGGEEGEGEGEEGVSLPSPSLSPLSKSPLSLKELRDGGEEGHEGIIYK